MATFDPSAAAPADSGIFGLPHSVEEAHVVVVPVPYAATTSYGGGAENGPRAVFEASKQVDLFDVETGKPYARGIAMVDEPTFVREWNDEARAEASKVIAVGGDIGNDASLAKALARVNELSDKTNEWTYATVRDLIARGKRVALIGGDHSTPYGCIRAHAEAFPGMGVLHVDAHADLRVAYEGFTHSHASIMHNVMTNIPGVARLVQVGLRDLSEDEHRAITGSNGRIVAYYDAEIARRTFAGEPWSQTLKDIVAALPNDVYISFDIDGLDPTLCPHTGTPVPGGLSYLQATALLGAVARSGRRIVGVDLNEVVPGDDGDEWDGNVGARLLYKLIGWMLVSQEHAPLASARIGQLP